MKLDRTVLAMFGWAALTAGATATVELAPGVTYDRQVRPGPQVNHVIRFRPGPLTRLEPVLTGGSPAVRGALTTAMAARADAGAVAAVNGDLFNFTRAYPSGIFALATELVSEPEPTRSALVVAGDGLFQGLRLQLAGSFQVQNPPTAGPAPIRLFTGINRPLERSSETAVYTPRFGPTTPADGNRVEAVVALDAGATLAANAPVFGTVLSVGPTGGQTPIGLGQVVIAASGTQGDQLSLDVRANDRIRLEAAIAGLSPGAWAIGGGPALVAGGVPIVSAGEGFTSGQMGSRTARTAVGQAGDGSIILATAEGPAQGSRGYNVAEQAELMADLGAQTAVAMDAGGSAQMTLGSVLAIPWASERPITNALVLTYSGVRIEPLIVPRVSPNGDGVADILPATVRSPVEGTVRLALERRGQGEVELLSEGPGSSRDDIEVDPAALGLNDGPYALHTTLTPADGGPPSEARQPFIVDRTLGGLRLRPRVVKKVARVEAQFTLVRRATLTLRVLDANGRVLRVPVAGRRLRAGVHRLTWDATLRRKPAIGDFRLQVEAITSLGRSRLDAPVKIVRAPKPKPSP